ncbi:MAG: quinolinate synthase NadA [Clostridia bacterium]|nr:quinolinate synthase NadA [Clostridia bacterium]
MDTLTIRDEILRLKKEKDVCILAHSYQSKAITEIADFTGDSYQLSVMASKTEAKTVIMCGVRFMAETVKILSPEKTVILSSPIAGCPMAEQMSKEYIENIKKSYPDYAVVAYINTTAELKTICDVCVTSASAVKIVKNIPNDKILFIPDCNLGSFVAKNVPEKTFKLLHGGCPIHGKITGEEARVAKRLHPKAKFLVHPECVPQVVAQADFIGSTTAIIDYAKASDAKEFIIGTEIAIAEYLQFECPDKKFYPLSSKLICPDMKATTLVDVYNILKGDGGEEILLDDETISKARACIDKMIELGG